jgi:ATP-dependent Lon protease
LAIGQPIKGNSAMTGEISLTGKVLRIGGLLEKVLASKREGITEVIVPEGNRADFEKLPKPVKEGINFHFVSNYSQVLNVVFDMNN